ncbi:3,4-dihydroxy-2-butanone-4-phosphate synthase [Motiliproteus sp. MSK22-1]|uniref:3,4-dihydroxy-2-butanone-4-phosphate synthase n=1 Tax=Motiliproteus sp. MSK22-1 TaxID=1897630 RepID=UPI0009FA28DF|nr:3,4-dihydroxy-2-butanone-4-phosphate synthase [Motiliproteus sp. MSK22-1]
MQAESTYQIPLDSIESALEDLKNGKFVILLDHPGREGEGDLIAAASMVTPEMINFQITHARGAFVAILMPEEQADYLKLPLQTPDSINQESQKTSFRLSCDTVHGSSGCSATDRAQTVNILGGVLRQYNSERTEWIEVRSSDAEDLVRPGHAIPISANPKGLQARQGHTEAAVELLRLAEMEPPVAVDMEILAPDGDMANSEYIRAFADKKGLKVISIPQLLDFIEVF